MFLTLTLLSLMGSPLGNERKQLIQLLEISDSQSRYDELRGLELSLPNHHFSEAHLSALVEIMEEQRDLPDVSPVVISRSALHILWFYYKAELMPKNVQIRFLKSLKYLKWNADRASLRAEIRRILISRKNIVQKEASPAECTPAIAQMFHPARNDELRE